MFRIIINLLKKIKNLPIIYTFYIHSIGPFIGAYKEKRKRKLFQKYGISIMREYLQLADNNHITVLCVFGTLLGIVRDGKLIPHDYDIDTLLLDVDKCNEFIHILKKNQFNIFRQFEISNRFVEFSFEKKGVYIDLHIPQFDDRGMYTYSMWRFPNKKYANNMYDEYEVFRHRLPIKGIKSKGIYDFMVNIPENDIDIVELTYGSKWKIPDPNFKHTPPEREILMVKETYPQ